MWYALGMRDEPNNIEGRYLPESIRLQIPLRSLVNLRRVAEELRGLAAQLDYISRYPTESVGTDVLEAAAAVRRSQERIAAIRYRGRPRLKHLQAEHTRSSGKR